VAALTFPSIVAVTSAKGKRPVPSFVAGADEEDTGYGDQWSRVSREDPDGKDKWAIWSRLQTDGMSKRPKQGLCTVARWATSSSSFI
jgi:hypothetical protein